MALAAAVSLALAAAAPSAAPLPPTGPWVVEAAESMCLLTHSYGTGPGKITVSFQPMFRMRNMEIMVLTPGKHGGNQRVGEARLKFGPGDEPIKGSYFSVELPGRNTRFTRVTVSSEVFDRLATASALSVKALPVDVTVEIKRADKAIAAFEACQNDLLASWGVDPASLTDGRAARPHNIAGLFGPNQYPLQALHSGIYGRVVTVLQVAADGTVSNCRVVASAGKALNDGTCAVAMRARFDPGTDASGKPVPSIYVLPVRWEQQ